MRKVLIVLAAVFVPLAARADYGNFMAGYTQYLPQPATTADFVSINNFQYMRPYMTPNMARELSPTNRAASQAAGQAGQRRVSQRPGNPNIARSAAVAPNNHPQTVNRRVNARPNNPNLNAARAATNNASVAMNQARSGVMQPTHQTGRARETPARAAVNTAPAEPVATVSMAQCMSEYRTCMDSYCLRQNTQWGRCFCSARLSQLEAEFQPQIERAQRTLIAVSISGKNADLSDAALTAGMSIQFDWAGNANAIRGQDAFIMGSQVCSARLRACSTVANQLVNLYRSEMNRDCQRYENILRAHLQSLEQQIASFK
ncbi:MAG: hypothetical protein FWD33_01190 [Alphaproteobacteria bacterium]|nr:hypothetical protein [Alphaproteobacteria bacterium]